MAGRDSTDFKVIIAGAGFSGLTLANCLELAGISYVVLEVRDAIGTDVGAPVSVICGPLLDQLGLYDKYYDLISPWFGLTVHNEKGDLLMSSPDRFELTKARSGYYSGMADRSDIIKMLYDNIPDKEKKVLTRKKISKVDHSPDRVLVYCEDGSSYTGDLVVGADGVHSRVLGEMWRASDEAEPGAISEKDRKPFTASYRGLVGNIAARQHREYQPGIFHLTFARGYAFLHGTSGREGVVLTMIEKLDRDYKAGELRYTEAEANEVAAKYAEKGLMPNESLKFGEVCQYAKGKRLVAIEDGYHETVTWGRFAMLGDAVHKTTPLSGAGAGLSMNSAAGLTNTLRRLLDESGKAKPSYAAIRAVLTNDYQIRRHPRSIKAVESCNMVSKIFCQENWIIRFLIGYVIPLQDPDAALAPAADRDVSMDYLDFVPPPERALKASMPYNSQAGFGHVEPTWRRLLRALPIIGLFLLGLQKLDPSAAVPDILKTVHTGRIEWASGSIEIYNSFTGVKVLDETLKMLTTCFAQWTFGFDEPGSWQATHFLNDVGIVYAIMLIESTRRANDFSLIMFPALFGWLAQTIGGGIVIPIYLLLHYLGAGLNKYKAVDMRLTSLQYTRTVFLSMVICYYVPAFMSFAAPVSNDVRYFSSWVWQLFPLWITIVQRSLAATVLKNTTGQDRIWAPTRDLPWIRFIIRSFVAFSALSWVYINAQAPFSLQELYVPSWTGPTGLFASLTNFMKWDYILISGSALFWLALLFRDMKDKGMIQSSWFRLALMAMGTIAIAGPGAAIGLAWLWREETLAVPSKMKGALTADSWRSSKQNGNKVHANGAANGSVKIAAP